MQIFLVGGAVRDQLLGLPVIERDWVVVGATPEQMLALGFQPVGKEFPVFLHPKTKEEYALARTERKVGKGYKGFIFYADPDVTLIQDLERRDLTINAMAQTLDGQIIDPYGGGEDIERQLLRHVSPAFAEDPVRILRVARFAAKLPNFQVHSETLDLMKAMVNAGEVNALVAERVWQELKKGLMEPAPERFWQVLAACGALPILFPMIQLNETILSAFRNAIALSQLPEVRLAALLHELTIHEVKALCGCYRIPRSFKELASLVALYLPDYVNLDVRHAEAIWKLLKACDAIRRPARFEEFLLTCQACYVNSQAIAAKLRTALFAMQMVNTQALQASGLSGPEFAEALRTLQIQAISQSLKNE